MRPPIPPPEFKTFGLFKELSSSRVKGSLDVPEALIMGGAGVAYLWPGRRLGRSEDLTANIFVRHTGKEE